jgi:drug/metabolite transporter (DMT)-like permease
MNKIKLSGFILAILFGAFMFVYGEFDDSPGGQLMGLLAVIAGIVGIVKSRKKTPSDLSSSGF